MDATILQRIAAREMAATVPDADCLLSVRCLSGDGYRESRYQGRYFGMAHRVVWLASGRTIPEGYTLDHLCERRNCLNVAHLEPVTLAENIARANAKRRAAVVARGACVNGHERTEASTYAHAGRLYCRPCNADAQRRRKGAAA